MILTDVTIQIDGFSELNLQSKEDKELISRAERGENSYAPKKGAKTVLLSDKAGKMYFEQKDASGKTVKTPFLVFPAQCIDDDGNLIGKQFPISVSFFGKRVFSDAACTILDTFRIHGDNNTEPLQGGSNLERGTNLFNKFVIVDANESTFEGYEFAYSNGDRLPEGKKINRSKDG